jgi:hypothetical protein
MGKIRTSSGKFFESNTPALEPFAQVYSQMCKILLPKNNAFFGDFAGCAEGESLFLGCYEGF